MSTYTDHDIKISAVNMFIEKIGDKNKTLASIIEDNYDELMPHLLYKIQRLGATDYSDKLLKDRNSKKERKELLKVISDGR